MTGPVEIRSREIKAHRIWCCPEAQREELLGLLREHDLDPKHTCAVAVDVVEGAPLLRAKIYEAGSDGRRYLVDGEGRRCRHDRDTVHFCRIAQHVEERPLRGPLPRWWKALPA